MGAFERVLTLQPADGECLLGRVMACLALDRDEEAAEELRAFDALNPPAEMQAIVDQSNLREELGVPAP